MLMVPRAEEADGMSDTPPGWWQASDGKWYPADQVPEPPVPKTADVLADSIEDRSDSQTDILNPDDSGSKFKAFLVLAVIAIAITAFLVLRSDSTYAEVYGTVTVDGKTCDDLGGYSDIPNQQIVIRDVDERFLIEMDPPIFGPTTFGTICLSTFSGYDLPKLDRYIVDSGRRGQIFVSADEFEPGEDGAGTRIFQLTIGG
jgi:hypothetical protein